MEAAMHQYEVLNMKTKAVEFAGSQQECRDYSQERTGVYLIREARLRIPTVGNANLGFGPAWRMQAA
jgi:hypothetical protein